MRNPEVCVAALESSYLLKIKIGLLFECVSDINLTMFLPPLPLFFFKGDNFTLVIHLK